MYGNDGLERSPSTLVLVPGAVFNKQKRNSGSAGFKNQGALQFIETKLYSHHETYSGDPQATSRQGFV